MADRKQSPDVLAELLGPELPAQPASRAAPVAPAPEPASIIWETEIVTLQDHRGWRPRYVNGAELPNWPAGPLVHDYLSQRGAEGWELAGAGTAAHFYGVSDGLQFYFKRRK